jgi:hypothetical protein
VTKIREMLFTTKSADYYNHILCTGSHCFTKTLRVLYSNR